MKFTKNMMGIFSTLILVILLTQSRFFNFLTESPLGRMVLLAFIILIAYTNKILGLLAVLSIIIAFNQYDVNVYEGLKIKLPSQNINADKTSTTDTTSTAATTAVQQAQQQVEEARRRAEEAASLQRQADEARRTAEEAAVLQRQADEARRRAEEAATLQIQLAEAKRKSQQEEEAMKKNLKDINNASQRATDKANKFSSVFKKIKDIGGREGFCMTDRESNMLRGKQSNTIPVFNNSMEQDDDVSPSDTSIFSSSFSPF